MPFYKAGRNSIGGVKIDFRVALMRILEKKLRKLGNFFNDKERS